MTEPTELLPCPFCGGSVELEETTSYYNEMHGNRRWWGVVCRNTTSRGGSCAIQQRPSASKEAAVERWNRRQNPSAALAADASKNRMGICPAGIEGIDMTTTQPEALRLADELCEAIAEYPEPTALEAQAAAELRRLHAYCQELESQVILDCMTHVQNPAEIEHVAGDVSKNGAGLNMSTQHARITELESQLAQRFDAAYIATAAAQGFRNGVAKEQQAGWQPIETAPKDGREILGYTEEVGALVMYWDTMSQEQDHWSDGMSISYWTPTHWMKLPEAPNA